MIVINKKIILIRRICKEREKSRELRQTVSVVSVRISLLASLFPDALNACMSAREESLESWGSSRLVSPPLFRRVINVIPAFYGSC